METVGRVLHQAWWYDALAWLWTGGKEREFRDRIVAVAPLSADASVLDIGCGTGTLAITLKERLGCCAEISGVDASEEMIARARSKARSARVAVAFETAVVEALPFAGEKFDVVFSTLMLHHLPSKARKQCLAEVRRVLKPGGSLVIADFETSDESGSGLLGMIHRRRHGHVKQENLNALLLEAGFAVVRSDRVGFGDVHVTLAQPQVAA